LTRGLTWKVLLPAVAAMTRRLLAAVPWLVWTLERDQIATLASRLAGAAREAGTVLPWTAGPDLDRKHRQDLPQTRVRNQKRE
jgi:hypothetical protein